MFDFKDVSSIIDLPLIDQKVNESPDLSKEDLCKLLVDELNVDAPL